MSRKYQISLPVNMNIPPEAIQQFNEIAKRLQSFSSEDLEGLRETLRAQQEANQWATDPLGLTPLLKSPQRILVYYLRSLAESLLTVATCIEETIG